MIEFRELDTRAVEFALAYNFEGGHTIRCLREVILFLEKIVEDPYDWPPLVFPAIPGDKPDTEPSGTLAFRPPGSPEEIVQQDAPPTMLARRALVMARELLRIVESDSANITPENVGEAIALGALLPRVLEWYNGVLKKSLDGMIAKRERLEAKAKLSRTQAAKGRKNSRTSDSEWSKIKRYIRLQHDQGISINQACKLASKQLLTSKFIGINRSIDISSDALRKRFSAAT